MKVLELINLGAKELRLKKIDTSILDSELIRSVFSLSKFTNLLAIETIPPKREYSFDFFANNFGSTSPDDNSFSRESC
ncbi:hypothetical protein OAN29_02390 [Pelagibacteraceae bacterium]|nr:hypothetical protein [Pelagibacteraceae bacterium]